MKDLYHNLAVQDILDAVNATTTKTSSTIDLQGFDSLSVIFSVGNSADTLSGSVYWTLKLTHSDDDSSYSDVTLSGLLNTSATYVINTPTGDNVAIPFGYIGGKRYVRAVATATGTHTNGTPMSMVALKGHPSMRPTI